MLEKVQRCCIEPLQIVEEQDQRVFQACEYLGEASEYQQEAILSVLWWKVRNRWLRTDYEFQFRDEVNNEQPIRVQRLPKLVAPSREFGPALNQQPADEALKCLRQRRIRDVALVLVELARCKKTARRHEHLLELVDN